MARIGIRILPEEFAAFKALAPNDPHFDCSPAEWEQRYGEGERQVTVHPAELVAYCRQIGRPPGFATLTALAAKKARNVCDG